MGMRIEGVVQSISESTERKSYSQLLKENTQTNLRSHKLENGKHSYTIQRNVIFAIPKKKEDAPKTVSVAAKSDVVVADTQETTPIASTTFKSEKAKIIEEWAKDNERREKG